MKMKLIKNKKYLQQKFSQKVQNYNIQDLLELCPFNM